MTTATTTKDFGEADVAVELVAFVPMDCGVVPRLGQDAQNQFTHHFSLVGSDACPGHMARANAIKKKKTNELQ